jgi:nitroreductase
MAQEAPAMQMLLSRRSVPALRLRAPAPSTVQIDQALDAALRAPDHGALRPWRFALIRGVARERLADLFEQRMLERDPLIAAGKIDKARARLSAAPLVIAVGARIISGHSIPEVEQLLSVGAAVMNLLNAFHAQGFGAIWLTGENSYDERIAVELGFGAGERCLGFVYVGSADGADDVSDGREGGKSAPPRPARSAHVREWTGG